MKLAGRIALLLALLALAAAGAIALAATWGTRAWGVLAFWTFFAWLLAAFILLGWLVTGTWKGIFLSKVTNAWSLATTQALLWTTIVLSGLLALWVARLHGGNPNPLGMALDANLLTVLGLPTAALTGGLAITGGKGRVATPRNIGQHEVEFARRYLPELRGDYMALSGRALLDPAYHLVEDVFDGPLAARPDAVARGAVPAGGRTLADAVKAHAPHAPDAKAFADFVEAYVQKARRGVLAVNLEPSEARLRDLLTGDEFGDAHKTEFGKVQFFLVSLLAMAAYCGTLSGTLHGLARGACDAACSATLPPLEGAFAALLLTSTAGYLGLKAASATS